MFAAWVAASIWIIIRTGVFRTQPLLGAPRRGNRFTLVEVFVVALLYIALTVTGQTALAVLLPQAPSGVGMAHQTSGASSKTKPIAKLPAARKPLVAKPAPVLAARTVKNGAHGKTAIAAIARSGAPAKSATAKDDAQEAASMTSSALLADSFGRLGAVLAILGIAALEMDRGIAGLGISPRNLPRGLLLGLLTLFCVEPLLFIISNAYTTLQDLFHNKKHTPLHPLLLAMENHPPLFRLVMMVFLAVVAAPISEEMFFRGLLQSSLLGGAAARRRTLTPGANGGAAGIGGFSSAPEPPSTLISTERQLPAPVPLAAAADMPASPGAGDGQNQAPHMSIPPVLSNPDASPNPADIYRPSAGRRWFAILVTSAVFAGIHYQPGLSNWGWFPVLFTLAVALGYIYERTGNIWANITVHAGFNAISTALILSGVFHGK